MAQQGIGALANLAVDSKVLQVLLAMARHLRLTLEQVAIEEKSNQIPALKPLLKKLDLAPGVLTTADAMHCRQESSRFTTQDLGGDYLFGLKGNQSGILDKAQRLFEQRGFGPSRPIGDGTRPAGPSAHRAGGRQP